MDQNLYHLEKLLELTHTVLGAAGFVSKTGIDFSRTKTSITTGQIEKSTANKLIQIINKMKNRIREDRASYFDLRDRFQTEVKLTITAGVRDAYLAGIDYVETATKIPLLPNHRQNLEISEIATEREEQFWRNVQVLVDEEAKAEEDRINVVAYMPPIATAIATIALSLGTKSGVMQANQFNESFSVAISVTGRIERPTFDRPPIPRKLQLVWVTERDIRVCPICRRLDGQTFFADDPYIPQPVIDSHENCRCRIMIYTEEGNKVFNG